MDLHTPCPHCGNRPSENTPHFTSYTSSAHAPKDKLALLNEEVGRLDDMIQELQQRRSMLLGRINTVQAPIISIPAEVLSQIFLYACPRVVSCKNPGRHPDITPPSVLIAVCSCWHQIATSTPELWTTVSLDKILPSTIHSDTALLNTSFKRAKRHPMSLSLNLASYELEDEDDDTPMPDHLVLKPLHEHADIIRSLRIYSMPIDWLGSIQWHQFSALIELRLHWTGDEYCAGEFSKRLTLPNTIKELSIHYLPYDVVLKLIPPTSITSLYLNDAEINQCVQLLAQCPNLLSFSSTNMKAPHPNDAQPNITGIVAMAHLKELRWEWTSNIWSYALIRHFHFPALRELRWKLCSSTLGNSVLEAFWSNLATTITKLDVSFESRPSSQCIAPLLLQIFRHFPGVVELGIEAHPPDLGDDDTAASAEGVLMALLGTSGGASTILPSLKVIRWMTQRPRDSLYYLFGDQSLDQPFIDASSLVRMLSTRKELGLKFFKLIWGGYITFEVKHEETMAELVASGLNVEIIREWYDPDCLCDQ